MHVRSAAISAALACSVLAGCASDDALDQEPAANTVAPVRTIDEPSVTLHDPGFAQTVPQTDPAVDDAGSCSVVISGGLDDAWDESTDGDSVTYGPWFDVAAVEAATEDSTPLDDTVLVITCGSAGGRAVNITANDSVPQRPATYPLRGRESDRLTVLVSTTGTELWIVQDGELVIDRFDGDHLAGSLSATIVPYDAATGAPATGSSPQRTASLELTFDLRRA